jgi:hypothetical protein
MSYSTKIIVGKSYYGGGRKYCLGRVYAGSAEGLKLSEEITVMKKPETVEH